MMKKCVLLTLGCRVNQYETQVIREGLLSLGFQEVGADENWDLLVLNTCAVTAESVRKGRQTLRRALRYRREHPEAVVCVCGCLPQGGELERELAESVDVLCGNTKKGSLALLLAKLCDTPLSQRRPLDLREEISQPRPYENMCLSRSHNARAFVKIEDGCNSFCSYCFVPLVRGRVRSRSMQEVYDEVVRLTRNGYREIVLTGIETGSYGQDFSDGTDLVSLVESLHGLPMLERIRFGSLKPTVFTESFCSRLAEMKKVMPHFHLSLQSGSDAVLKAMRRTYSREQELLAIQTIRNYFPDVGLSADLICGFPSETEGDFLDSVSLVRKAGLSHTHIFPFSPRKGTLAASMEQSVSEEEKKRRCAHLLDVAKEQSVAFFEQRRGREYRVLCERVRDGAMLGYTENFLYTKTEGEVPFEVGRIYTVRIGDRARFSVETLTADAKCLK